MENNLNIERCKSRGFRMNSHCFFDLIGDKNSFVYLTIETGLFER